MRIVPNLLTLARIALAPVVVLWLVRGAYPQALALFFLAGATDGVDGVVARRFGAVTRAGAYLDPIADKVLLGAVYLALGAIGAAPWWLVFLIFGRDVLILLFAAGALAFSARRDFAPSAWGKLSTFLQIGAAVWVMTDLALPAWSLRTLSPAVFIIAAAGTAGSGIAYAWRSWRPKNGDGSG